MSGDAFNRAIIENGFKRKPGGDQNDATSDDIQLDVQGNTNGEFQIDPESIDAEFTTVSHEKRSKKRKLLMISLAAVAVFSTFFFILHFLMGQKEAAPAVIGPQGIPEPVAQTPSNLNSLNATLPASLAPAEVKSELSPHEPKQTGGEVVEAKAITAAPAQVVTPAVVAPAPMLPVTAPVPPAPVLPMSVQPAQAPAPVLPVAAQQVVQPQTGSTPDSLQTSNPASALDGLTKNPVTEPKSPDPQLQLASGVSDKPKSKPAEKPEAKTPVKTEKKDTEKAADKPSEKGESKSNIKSSDSKTASKEKASDKPTSKAVAVTDKPKAEPQEAAAMESVKPLVSFSAGQLGVRSFSQDTLILLSSKTNSPVRYRVGDTLPSGDVIEHLDSNSMTVVTNLKVIRITN